MLGTKDFIRMAAEKEVFTNKIFVIDKDIHIDKYEAVIERCLFLYVGDATITIENPNDQCIHTSLSDSLFTDAGGVSKEELIDTLSKRRTFADKIKYGFRRLMGTLAISDLRLTKDDIDELTTLPSFGHKRTRSTRERPIYFVNVVCSTKNKKQNMLTS